MTNSYSLHLESGTNVIRKLTRWDIAYQVPYWTLTFKMGDSEVTIFCHAEGQITGFLGPDWTVDDVKTR